MKRYLKALSIVLSATILLSTTAFATETTNFAHNQSDSIGYKVMCAQYPDAYIIVNNNINNQFASSNEKNSLSVSATVFVEEKNDYENGEVVTSSRLLSKDEVDAIGQEIFVDANVPQPLKTKLGLAQNSLYKLTIRADGNYTTSGNSVTAYISSAAKWSGMAPFRGKEDPDVGKDYFGFAWSGDFTANQSHAEAFYSDSTPMQSNPAPITLSTGVPNAARIWMFDEYKYDNPVRSLYISDAGISTVLSKNTKTGNGNTAEVMAKYIHTYQAHTGSISVNAGASGVGAGYSLSSCEKQWELACFITGIPY